MSNALRYIGVGFLALITLIIVAVVALFYTPPGRQFVKAQAEQQIASAINGTASIGDLASGLPGYLRVDDVVINDSAEGQRPLLTAEGLEIAWDPLALVFGSINIKSISLQKARLDRLP
ncbi:MAG: AsmA family protein, partial [Pseudomonadota bacterium]